MRILAGMMLSMALALGAPYAQATPPASNHPILGIWVLMVPATRCTEVYRFRGDGTTLVTSAAEISESEFDISATPNENGLYRLDDRIVKQNGKPDCSGALIQVGSKATNFIHFHPSGALFLMCSSESMDACIGPFHRVVGQDT